MRIVAFSCAHLMTRSTQLDVYGYTKPLDYNPLRRLIADLINDPPDVVVNLGDFTEPVYEDDGLIVEVLLPYYERLCRDVRAIKLRGNHDKSRGDEFVELDDVRYEHGHKLTRPGDDGSVEGYVTSLREATKGRRLVHGHSHAPKAGWPLDVGSITFSQSYGEITDGVPSLKYMKVLAEA